MINSIQRPFSLLLCIAFNRIIWKEGVRVLFSKSFCKYFYHIHSLFLFNLTNNNLNGNSSFQTYSNGCHVTFIIWTLVRASVIHTNLSDFHVKRNGKSTILKSEKKERENALRAWAHTQNLHNPLLPLFSFSLSLSRQIWCKSHTLSCHTARVDWKFVYFVCVRVLRAFVLWTKTAMRLRNLASGFFSLLSFASNVERRMTSMQISVYIFKYWCARYALCCLHVRCVCVRDEAAC